MASKHQSLYKKIKNYEIKNYYEYIHFKQILTNKENDIAFLQVRIFYTDYDDEFTDIAKIIEKLQLDIYFLRKKLKKFEFFAQYKNYYSYENDILLYPIIEESNYDLELVQN